MKSEREEDRLITRVRFINCSFNKSNAIESVNNGVINKNRINKKNHDKKNHNSKNHNNKNHNNTTRVATGL